ncbi:MAG: indole-3-glycerol-phosphate synthase [Chloracidobacterium sp.]|uniref:indole-3-glycerol-phosphate synthase n=1 Tax=Chloracidobacterium validum TaxID=2821543 RepID=A0ABX8B4J5_9BACT|nr:indole-3-glycerol-phosphate synthase [Chloracidobacterium validum]QUW01898.1 indole-3-glycerol-phosphate synthase [Chloracidobacterium validum]
MTQPVSRRPTLSEIVAARRQFLTHDQPSFQALAPARGTLLPALQTDAPAIIAEIKPISPSDGVLQAQPDLPAILSVYDARAAAISVLTEPRYFGGSLDLLREVAGRSSRPTLCKDFILDIRQVHAARAAGAEAVLLIVKILDDERLQSLHAEIERWNMTPVVEVQTEAELERALAVDPSVMLINNRNLETFEISLDTTKRLAPRVPLGIVTVAASGIHGRADIEALLPYCTRFLVGTHLMRAPDLTAAFDELLGRARA